MTKRSSSMANVEKIAKADVSRQMGERAPALYLGLSAVGLVVTTVLWVLLYRDFSKRTSDLTPDVEVPTITKVEPTEPNEPSVERIPDFDPLAAPPARILPFPEDRVAETVYTGPWNPEAKPRWKKLGEVEIPANQIARLQILGEGTSNDMSYLSAFNHDDLYYLDILNKSITDTQLGQMAHLTSLRDLKISAAESITGEGLGILSRFIHLKGLNPRGSSVAVENFVAIGKLTTLERLDL